VPPKHNAYEQEGGGTRHKPNERPIPAGQTEKSMHRDAAASNRISVGMCDKTCSFPVPTRAS